MFSFLLSHRETTSNVHTRVAKARPELQGKLETNATEAMFMLSRTNILQSESDECVCDLLTMGITLCADNSLEGGWGGRGWVAKYVKDAAKTDCGVLVLDTCTSFFHSEPCCDEIYAAWQAGIPLTKIAHGYELATGEYLWIQFTPELFFSHAEYERKMRKKWGDRYTPCWSTMTLGGYYCPDLKGRRVTYFCIVPSSDSSTARRTGADKQRF